jgi:hypothetical protein
MPAHSITLALHAPSNSKAVHTPPPLVPPPSGPPSVARVVIVIDDIGQTLAIAKDFLDLPLDLTLAILPFQKHSKEIAQLAAERRREVILHLPMEPHGFPQVRPGTGALLLSMSAQTLQDSLRSALDCCPKFAGINNHMGSHFTENREQMRVVLEVVKERGLYFLDSYTSKQSVGFTLAKDLSIPTLRRDVFLDHQLTDSSVRAQFQQLIRRAKIQGTAVAIGHPHEVTLRVLKQEMGRFERERIAVVAAGELLRNP